MFRLPSKKKNLRWQKKKNNALFFFGALFILLETLVNRNLRSNFPRFKSKSKKKQDDSRGGLGVKDMCAKNRSNCSSTGKNITIEYHNIVSYRYCEWKLYSGIFYLLMAVECNEKELICFFI